MTLSTDPIGKIGILRGAWQPEDLAEFVRSGADRLIVHAAPDLEFLRDLPALRGLEIHHLPLSEVRPIESQGKLRDLSLNAYFKTPVDFSLFTELKSLHLDWGPGAESIGALRQLQDLSINRYPGSDLALFHDLARLRILRLASAPRLTSLLGIDALKSLEELRLLDLRVLSDLDPIAGVSETLRSLEFNTCRKIGRLDALRALRNLTKLHVPNCGVIESLAPVLGLPLKTLLFYESTNIRDGDLGVLLKLPELTDTSFANRRHYSNTREDIQARLSAKG